MPLQQERQVSKVSSWLVRTAHAMRPRTSWGVLCFGAMLSTYSGSYTGWCSQ